ncbi:MAG: UDP-N-acetylmuramoyl-tripeptide--D-alanyl-D-alanine ligase [Rikenellaceae bacterium]|jgi:UDP-N-acetylmuramoyl-tripeptide--D-alanyl-D-alanine ligase|nr:UDP-N-acetylmuramoyl-tripeptide--D-alanyl-D-alanine ligase [Rikenellaceae bacterium]
MTVERLYEIFLSCTGASTDTRSITPGAMFFALRGERFDANSFATQALDAGAAWAVVDNPELAGRSDRFIVVGDSLTTLQELAACHRRQLAIPILAITGSNGKTTTKELTSRVLARRFKVAVTRGNLNNHIGVPLTLLSMTRDTEMGVVEMGAGAQGEIALLCSIAQPDYGLITNVGRAHLEGFGSEEGVRHGKGELYDYLASAGGTAFYASGDATLSQMIAERPGLKTVGYPCLEPSDGSAVRWRGREVTSQLVGDYNRHNISAAVAIGEYFGVSEDDIAAAVNSYAPDNRRSQRIVTARNTIVADCYNANPSSMAAALDNFAREPFPRPKAVILGDMLELGNYSAAEHAAIIRQVAAAPTELALLVGENFAAAATAEAATESAAGTPAAETPAADGEKIRTFPTFDALATHLHASPLTGYAILIKGSRGLGLERALELL